MCNVCVSSIFGSERLFKLLLLHMLQTELHKAAVSFLSLLLGCGPLTPAIQRVNHYLYSCGFIVSSHGLHWPQCIQFCELSSSCDYWNTAADVGFPFVKIKYFSFLRIRVALISPCIASSSDPLVWCFVAVLKVWFHFPFCSVWLQSIFDKGPYFYILESSTPTQRETTWTLFCRAW